MSRRLSEERDGRALGVRERLHLWLCDVCSRLRVQLGVLGRAAGASRGGGSALSPEAKARLRRALERGAD
ncbi:MAG TPA: zf-HC2 domain-containing protein [Elusimicrobiota bacterium]|nr:zf-HC2 domain-containing protein [Elusimicrobiota bacterium]